MAPLSTHYACLSAIRDIIAGLGLLLSDQSTPLPGASVILIQTAWVSRIIGQERSINPPAIVISPDGPESHIGGTNAQDDIAYPIYVTIVGAANQVVVDAPAGTNPNSDADTWLGWRQKISKAIRHQRLSGVDTILTVNQIDSREVIMPTLYQAGWWTTCLAFSCISRETRGA